jgi:acrylyl-CoA reductase (NADPH)
LKHRTFSALIVDREDEQVRSSIRKVEMASLPDGEVLVEIAYSSLNYKDGLAVTGRNKVIRRYPLTPGIDLAQVPDFATRSSTARSGAGWWWA